MSSNISLTVGRRLFEGWKEVRVVRGIDRLAGAFGVTVSDKPWRIVPGEPVIVKIDGEPVITGWIDTVAPSYDASSHNIQVTGRSKTGDLVDCSRIETPNEWLGQKLHRIAADLCEPFGIEVQVEVDVGGPIEKFSYNPGNSIADELLQLAARKGVMMTDDEAGRVVITTTGRGRAPAALERGVNILSGSGQVRLDRRFSNYVIVGQHPGSDFRDGTDVTGVHATAEDPGVGRYRPKKFVDVFGPIDQDQARRSVRHQASWRFGRAAEFVYRVARWRAGSDKRLWRPNETVSVRDDWMNLDRDMLIAAVEFTYGAGGEESRLTVTRPEAFELLPQPKLEPVGDDWANVAAAPRGERAR